MRIGPYRHRITISRKTVSGQNSYGEDVSDYTTTAFGPFWAEVTALRGRELESARQTWAEARFRVRMRHQPGVTVRREDRITWGTRTLDILDAEDQAGRQREIVMYCRELVA
ncbi:MAG: hypothetical protein A2Z18_11075 [Armatimonadetes bacterium RBG_16_58_9]|nr:MAG: hypothetical protein A2Z18_11075 [Armatimonadetes bacterium RBG_16_58_9]